MRASLNFRRDARSEPQVLLSSVEQNLCKFLSFHAYLSPRPLRDIVYIALMYLLPLIFIQFLCIKTRFEALYTEHEIER